jgi:hypothetical protein
MSKDPKTCFSSISCLQHADQELDAGMQQLQAVLEQVVKLLRESSSWLMQAVDLADYVAKSVQEHTQFAR